MKGDLIRDHAHLMAMKPREGYVFHSDYFTIDGSYATILALRHLDGADDRFAPFWGVGLVPVNLPERLAPHVSTVNLSQACRMGDGWLADHQGKAEHVADMNAASQDDTGTNSSRHRARKNRADLSRIAQELNNGASYLNVHHRLLVKADSLEHLDEAVERIERQYNDTFASIVPAAYPGRQRDELATLLAPNAAKHGKGWHFTSTELAGEYHLVTHGLEDAHGTYVGYMVEDVNNSAILFDVDAYPHHAMIAGSGTVRANGQPMDMASAWAVCAGQHALMHGHHAIHLVLDDAADMGTPMDEIGARVDMAAGDLNMFEMFGSQDMELAVFPAQLEKLALMAEQSYQADGVDLSIMRSTLFQIATDYYVDQGMWSHDAAGNRDRLRVVDLPHNQVPLLHVFCSYLDEKAKAAALDPARDEAHVQAVKVLAGTFRHMLAANGDLFDKPTSQAIDRARQAWRTVYEFGPLMARGGNVAMMQLVNAFGFATGTMEAGDVLVIHGADRIDPAIEPYLASGLERVYAHGGRTVFAYHDVDRMVERCRFNRMDQADWQVLGTMNANACTRWQEAMGVSMPPMLAQAVTNRARPVNYIHRGVDNVVFAPDLTV